MAKQEMLALADFLAEQNAYHSNSMACHDPIIQAHVQRLSAWEKAVRLAAQADAPSSQPVEIGQIAIVTNDQSTQIFPVTSDSSTSVPQSPPVSQGAIAQVLMDEGYVHLNSFELADIILKNWDVKSLPDTRPDRKCK
jgi:hypothetical protein